MPIPDAVRRALRPIWHWQVRRELDYLDALRTRSSRAAFYRAYSREIALIVGALLIGAVARLSSDGSGILNGIAVAAGAVASIMLLTVMGVLLRLVLLDRAVHVEANWHSRKLEGTCHQTEIARRRRILGEGGDAN